jgi:hypothetical protein
MEYNFIVSVPLRGKGFERRLSAESKSDEGTFQSPCGERVLKEKLEVFQHTIVDDGRFSPLAGKGF